MPLALACLAFALGPAESFAHGGFDERIAQISAALKLQPDNAALRFELASVRCEQGEWAVAVFELDEVDRIAPGKFPTDLIRGEAFLAGTLAAEAKRALDRFLAANPAHGRALMMRARAHTALKEAGACLADYAAVWRITDRPEPDLVQEYAVALTAHGHPEEALRVLEAGIQKVGAVPGLVLLALEREMAMGRFDVALARIQVLQQSAPRAEPWMAKRAELQAAPPALPLRSNGCRVLERVLP